MNMQFITAQFADARLIELRTLPDGTSSLHKDAESLLKAVQKAPPTSNQYITLNRPRETYRASHGRALGNDDMEIIVRLLFDFDPVRGRGFNATARDESDVDRQYARQCKDDQKCLQVHGVIIQHRYCYF